MRGRLLTLSNGLSADRRGSVMVMFALFLTTLLVAIAFMLNLSRLHLARQKGQLVSDLAVLAAVNTANPFSGVTPSRIAIATARAVATANGFDPDQLLLSAGVSPNDAAATALKATIAQDVPLPIGLPPLGSHAIVNVASWAQAGGAGMCFRSQTGPINIYDDAVVASPACRAEAKTYLHLCGRSRTTLASVTTGYSASAEQDQLCETATYRPAAETFRTGETVTDTIVSSAPVTGMRTHLDAMANGWPFGTVPPVRRSAPPGPNRDYNGTTAVIAPNSVIGSFTVTNANLRFAGSGAPDPACNSPTSVAGTATMAGTNRLILASGCYIFAAGFTALDDSDTEYAVAPGASVVFLFNGTMTMAPGSRLTFGNATICFDGGTVSNNGGSLSFGDGPFYLWGGGIANGRRTSTLSFGDGPFYFYGGSVSNDGMMTLGKGPFWFKGGSLTMNAGSTTSFGVGNLEFYGGTVTAGGESVTFGAGGSASQGSGAVSMYGGSFKLTSRSLTAIGTSFGFSGGTVSLLGVGTIRATAPTDPTPALGYRNLLFGVWGGAFSLYQADRQADIMSGIIYVPTTNASLYGSQTIRPPPGGCFGVVAGVLDIYQNARIYGAPCAGLSGGVAGSAMLVQ